MTLTISEFFCLLEVGILSQCAQLRLIIRAQHFTGNFGFFTSIHISLLPAARKTLCAHTLKFELFKRLNHCYQD